MAERGMKIYRQISAIMAEVGSVGKTQQTESGQRFYYRGVEDAVNALAPIMTKYKVFAVPEVLDSRREEFLTAKNTKMNLTVLTVRFTFFADDGSNVSAVTVGEAMDAGDRASGKAMSNALKYALYQVFCIPTQESAGADPHEAAMAAVEKIGNKQAAELLKTLQAANVNIQGLLEMYEVKSLGELSRTQHDDILSKLKSTKAG